MQSRAAVTGILSHTDYKRSNIMGKAFGGGTKKAKAPAPAAPAPTPTEIDAQVKQKDQDRRRQRIAAAGRGGTILNQGTPLTGQSTILGRGA